VDTAHFLREVGEAVGGIEPEAPFPPLGSRERIDRLVDGEPATGSKDAKGLLEGARLVLDVDEDGARRDDVDAFSSDPL